MGCMLVYDVQLVLKLYEPVCLKELAYDGKLLLGAFCKKNLVVIAECLLGAGDNLCRFILGGSLRLWFH